MPSSKTPLADEPFAFTATKAGKVLITHHGKQARILQGREAQKFMSSIETMNAAQAQLLMARTTGQFKFGNERNGKTGGDVHSHSE